MDDRLKKAIEFSNYRVSLFNSKENIKIKVDSMLTYAINGGVFKASIELINFTRLVTDTGRDSVVLIDINNNPIEITNVTDFHDELMSRYFQATNYYHTEYMKLKKARSVKDQFTEIFSEEE